jgi:stage IV sporulation protein FB
VLLIDPPATPFDLRFRLFGVDVRVHPFFWLLSVILGWNLTVNPVLSDNGMLDLAVWVLACFLSILLHEFGHVWMGQAFGSRGHIVLHSMGGLAIGAGNVRASWQRILVSFAGPAIQLALWAALFGVLYAGYRPEPRTPLSLLVWILLTINLYWPLLNLLPIWPLDGGQITREAFAMASPRQGAIAALYLSLAVSAALAVNALMGRNGNAFIPYAPTSTWMLILFAMFAVGSWQAIQQEKMAQHEYGSASDDRMPWER